MSHTQTVSKWIEQLKWEDLPPEVIHEAKRCLLDFVGCAVGGARSTPGKIAKKLAEGWGGPPEATIIGGEICVAARHSAFANATMANALDFDDTLHGHPGSTTFATVLAAGEKWNSNGKEILLSAVIGYEMSVRAMGLMQPIIPRYIAMWDLGTLQAYGAAAASARLAGLSWEGISNAIGLITATTTVPHPRKQRFPGEGRPMLKSAYGWASDAAIVAAEAALADFSGPGNALDDNMGFWVVKPSTDLGLENFSDKLGINWAILKVSFKPFPACRFVHPVLQAVQQIMQRKTLQPEEIKEIQIRSFSLLADEHHAIYRPISATDALFSVPFTVSALIIGRGLSPESYSDTILFNPKVLSLADRVKVFIDEYYDKNYPARLGAHVQIIFTDGSSEEVRIENPKGAPDDPMTDDELGDKFRELVAPIFGKPHTEELLSCIDHLETLESAMEFTKMLRASER